MEFDFPSAMHCLACLVAGLREFISGNDIEGFSVLPYITLSIFCALLKSIKELMTEKEDISLLPHCLRYVYFNAAIIILMHAAFVAAANAINLSILFHIAIVGATLFISYFICQIIRLTAGENDKSKDGDGVIGKLQKGEMPK